MQVTFVPLCRDLVMQNHVLFMKYDRTLRLSDNSGLNPWKNSVEKSVDLERSIINALESLTSDFLCSLERWSHAIVLLMNKLSDKRQLNITRII